MNFLKKILVLMAFSAHLLATPAATASGRSMEISLNPASLIEGSIEGAYRFAVKHNIALSFHLKGLFFSWAKEAAASGVDGGIGAKFFLTNDAFSNSWFIEPGLHVSNLAFTASDRFWRLSPQVVGGYGWVWSSGFSLNLGLGVRYNYAFAETKPDYRYHGFYPAGEFSIGYAW